MAWAIMRCYSSNFYQWANDKTGHDLTNFTRAIPEKCEAVFGQELRKNKELEQME